jgi:RND superfamily putative drug exporter
VAGWIAVAVCAILFLPALEDAEPAPLGGLVPEDSAALEVATRSAELFRFPALADTAVVQRDPDGLSPAAQLRVFERAARLTRRPDADATGIAFLLPITNTLGLFPASREESTTAVTYLFVLPDRTLRNRADLAELFAARYVSRRTDSLVGVTGAVPAQLEQFRLIGESLPLIEAATLGLLAIIVAVAFRSLVAPLVTLVTAAIAYVVASRAVAAVGGIFGFSVPREVEPLLVVLLLAIVTDYCIFFLSDFRERLHRGEPRREAVVATTATIGHIVLVAGLIVAAGTASLLAGQLSFFRVFGPGLALTAIVGALASVTLVPALLSLLGGATFWPSRGVRPRLATRFGDRAEQSGAWMTGLALRRPFLTVLACAIPLLGVAAVFLTTSLGLTLIRGLPPSSEPRRAAAAAATGFAPGILSPTELLLEAPGIASERLALALVQTELEREPGVAAVIGPRDIPVEEPLGAALSPTGDAARMLIVLETAPLSGPGIDRVRALQRRIPRLVADAGLDARAGLTGATALARETVDSTIDDLRRIALAAGLVNLVLLVLFLRALVAPVYLLLTSLLALGASLGLTTLVFQHLLGYGDVTYYVPFIAAVLLVSLGSDYNVFVVGRIWHSARDRPLRAAVADTAPQAARAIAPAGLALALSFALLAVVPLRPFRELAFALAVGVLLETFVVRALLVPALIAIFGPLSRWPAKRRLAAGGSADAIIPS